jgi:hypothetical protein
MPGKDRTIKLEGIYHGDHVITETVCRVVRNGGSRFAESPKPRRVIP